MDVAERVLPAEGEAARYEQRYTVKLGHVAMMFVRRPVSVLPAEGTVCFADCGPRLGSIGRQGVALFKGGEWTNGKGKPLSFDLTHWTVMEPNDGA